MEPNIMTPLPERCAAIDKLLPRIGINQSLIEFLKDHLLTVLRNQFNDLTIEMLELRAIGDCTLNGMVNDENSMAVINMLSFPVELTVRVSARHELYELNLRVIITSNKDNDGYRTFSDLFVQCQNYLGPR